MLSTKSDGTCCPAAPSSYLFSRHCRPCRSTAVPHRPVPIPVSLCSSSRRPRPFVTIRSRKGLPQSSSSGPSTALQWTAPKRWRGSATPTSLDTRPSYSSTRPETSSTPNRRRPSSDTSDPAAASSASTRRATPSIDGRGTAGSSAPGSRATPRSSARRSISQIPTIPRRKACPAHGSAPTNGTISAATRGARWRFWRPSTRPLTPAARWAPTIRSHGARRWMGAAAGIPRWATPRNPIPSRCFAFTCWAGSKAPRASPVPARLISGRVSADEASARLAIGETVLNGDADQIGGARHPQLGFDLATIIRGGLVTNAERVGDLGEAAALRQKTQDFQIARGKVFERLRRGSDIREHQFLGNLALDIGAAAGDASDCFEKLVRRDVLADIARCSRLQRAHDVDRVVVHAEDQNTRLGIHNLQARDDLETANVGQVQIEDDEVGPLSPKNAQRLFSARRLLNLRCQLGAEQSSQSGSDYRVIVDD